MSRTTHLVGKAFHADVSVTAVAFLPPPSAGNFPLPLALRPLQSATMR